MRYTARATNADPISCRPRRWRSWPVPDSSQITTVDAPISIRESRANPASATERALIAANARTTIAATFQLSVTDSRTKPRRNVTFRVVWSPGVTRSGLVGLTGGPSIMPQADCEPSATRGTITCWR